MFWEMEEPNEPPGRLLIDLSGKQFGDDCNVLYEEDTDPGWAQGKLNSWPKAGGLVFFLFFFSFNNLPRVVSPSVVCRLLSADSDGTAGYVRNKPG